MTKKTIVSIILVLVITLGLCLLISGCDSTTSDSPRVVREEVSGERYESIYVQIKYWSRWAKVESYKIYDNDIVEIVLSPEQSLSDIMYGNIVVANLDTVAFWHKEKNQSISS